MAPQSVDKYMSAVDALYDVIIEPGQSQGKRRLFVATDDKTVIQEVISLFFNQDNVILF